MKIISLRTTLLAAATFATLAFSSSQASAAVNIGISVGGPPPPPRVEHRWAAPYRGAVWIPGHNEWIRGRWVWVGGYYTYPPRHGAVWVQPRYYHGHYYNGYWR